MKSRKGEREQNGNDRLKDKNKLWSYDVQSKEMGETKFTKFGGLPAILHYLCNPIVLYYNQ